MLGSTPRSATELSRAGRRSAGFHMPGSLGSSPRLRDSAPPRGANLARWMERADTPVSEAGAERREGANPSWATVRESGQRFELKRKGGTRTERVAEHGTRNTEIDLVLELVVRVGREPAAARRVGSIPTGVTGRHFGARTGIARGRGLCLAHTATGFDSLRFHWPDALAKTRGEWRPAGLQPRCPVVRLHSPTLSSRGPAATTPGSRPGYEGSSPSGTTSDRVAWARGLGGMTPVWHAGSPGSTPGGSTRLRCVRRARARTRTFVPHPRSPSATRPSVEFTDGSRIRLAGLRC